MDTYRYRYSRRIPVRILHAYHFNPVEMSGRDAMPGLTIFEGWWPKRYRRERERHVDLTLPPRYFSAILSSASTPFSICIDTALPPTIIGVTTDETEERAWNDTLLLAMKSRYHGDGYQNTSWKGFSG